MTSESVRQAAAIPDMNHRDPAFLRMVRETKDRLVALYPGLQTHTPYLIGGSGTAAVEAMVTSLCPPDRPVLLLANGYYSRRIAEILEIHDIRHKILAFEWLDPIDLDEVARELSKGPYHAVLATHHETTSGRLNPIDELAKICRRSEALCLIDAMSSFGADSIDPAGVDALCSSANKCLHGLPGVSFVLVKQEHRALMESIPRRTYYLSLPLYEGDKPPLTPPVPALSALREALTEVPLGSAAARRADYEMKARLIRTGLKARDFTFAIPEGEFSCSLTVASIPKGWSWDRWFAANLEHGYMLYECKGDLKERFFQASNMGEVTGEQLEGWLLAVDQILSKVDLLT
jgi:2-aminoethylphosphonate-pyruvate transaminase